MKKNTLVRKNKIPEKLEQTNKRLLEKGYGKIPLTKKIVKPEKEKKKIYRVNRKNLKQLSRLLHLVSHKPKSYVVIDFS